MNDLFGQSQSDEETKPALTLLMFGIGIIAYLIGKSIGSERAWNDAREWAVETAHQCEVSYLSKGFDTVAACLQGAVDTAKQEERIAKEADGPYDPR